MRIDALRKVHRRLRACGVAAAAAVAAAFLTAAWLPKELPGDLPGKRKTIAVAGDAAALRQVDSDDPLHDLAEFAPEIEKPATAVAIDTSALPLELANFFKSRSAAHLMLTPGVPLPSSSSIPANPQLWKQLAGALAADPIAATEVLSWLSAQRQESAYIALAAFWGELSAHDVVPVGLLDGAQAIGTQIGAIPLPVPGEAVAMLAGLDFIPGPVLQDFQKRIRRAQGVYSDLVAMAAESADAKQAAALLALGGGDTPWDVLFTSRETTQFGKSAAVDVIAEQPDAVSIDRLLAYAQAREPELAVLVGAQWAQRQLSGERLIHLEELARAGAFQGANFRLLTTLLANAEDRDAAADVAGRLGVSLPAFSRTMNRPGD